MARGPVYVVGTCDTKGAELAFARACIRAAGVAAILVDVSTTGDGTGADIAREVVAACHPHGAGAVLGLDDRGLAVSAMGTALERFLVSQPDVGGVLGIGGSGNTAIVTAAMRALPVGLPKLMVSTMASGDVGAYVGPSDITMMHSVADIAGLNSLTRTIIGNAAHAIAGMVSREIPPSADTLPALGLTMFGVTTTAVTAIRERLQDRFTAFVFHATGTGGQCFEKLIESGFFAAAMDVTTTEVADHLFGGILPCTADRFGSVIRTRLPYVGSVGAVDMVNFGARESMPRRFADRLVHVHNPHVTLMRTTAAENAAIGAWIVERLNRMEGPVRFLLPLGGVSALDAPGLPFHDPVADNALFDAIRTGWRASANRRLVEVNAHINAPEFADAAVAALLEIAG